MQVRSRKGKTDTRGTPAWVPLPTVSSRGAEAGGRPHPHDDRHAAGGQPLLQEHRVRESERLVVDPTATQVSGRSGEQGRGMPSTPLADGRARSTSMSSG